MRIQKLATVCPKADIPVCHIVEVSVVHSWSFSLNLLNLNIRRTYASNWESMPLMVLMTTKLLTTSLPFSTPSLSPLSQPFTLNMRTLSWYVDIMQPKTYSMSTS